MENSNNKKVLLWAYNKGYKVDRGGNVWYNSKMRSLGLDTKGYKTFTVNVKLDNKRVSRRVWVHRLQAYQKYGDALLVKRIEVRHKNNNREDNSYDNILIGTHVENMRDLPPQARLKYAINASNKIRKFNDGEVKNIMKDRREGMTYKELCVKYNTIKSTLSYLFNKAIYSIGK